MPESFGYRVWLACKGFVAVSGGRTAFGMLVLRPVGFCSSVGGFLSCTALWLCWWMCSG
ncbi:hypothetical protein BKA80DRAFT_281765 [Phyllosticta citrichinensis]